MWYQLIQLVLKKGFNVLVVVVLVVLLVICKYI